MDNDLLDLWNKDPTDVSSMKGVIGILNLKTLKNWKLHILYCRPITLDGRVALRCGWDLAECGWDLAEWLELLTANAVVATYPGFDPSIFRYSGIWGAVDEAVLNIVHKENKSNQIPLENGCGEELSLQYVPYLHVIYCTKVGAWPINMLFVINY